MLSALEGQKKRRIRVSRNGLLIILILLAAAAIGAVAAIGTPSTQKVVSIAVGVPSRSFEFLPVFFANYSGFWRNYGLNVTVSTFQGDAQLAIAVSSGAVVIGVDSAFPIVGLVSTGFAVKIVAQLSDMNDYVLVVRASSRYTNVTSLDGTTIGVPSNFGVAHQLAVNLQNGYRIKLNIVNSGGIDNETGALVRNQTQSFVTTYDNFYEDQSSLLGFRSILNFSALYPDEWKTETVVFARNDAISVNPASITQFLKALFYSVKYMESHSQKAESFASTYLDLTTSAANLTVRRALSTYQANGNVSLAGLNYAIQFDVAANMIQSTVPSISQIYTGAFTPVKP